MLRQETYIEILKQEITPAIGCTEPIAIAFASAKTKLLMQKAPERARLLVSKNIMKNAMGVGIPGTGTSGIDLAVALGIFGADASAGLEVLHQITPQDVARAKAFALDHVEIGLKDTEKKLYIEVEMTAGGEKASVVVEDAHTHITKMTHNGELLLQEEEQQAGESGEKDFRGELTIAGILNFVENVEAEQLRFLDDCIEMNTAIAQEGLRTSYGLCVGKTVEENVSHSGLYADMQNYAVAMAAAAADARMSGCTLPVMTVCGSGNQGITATVPVIAMCRYMQYSREQLYRALALSCLVTIHVKYYIGKLSPICGCGVGSSIGVSCALVYLAGGGLEQLNHAVSNMVADISGIVCDGAKSGCALKVATVVGAAFKCAMLSIKGHSAGSYDGIVSEDVETTIRNLGKLGNEGMSSADQVILDIMVCK